MTFDELAARVARLEGHKLTTDDLPMAPLQRKLERSWQPDAGVLLQAKSVTADALGRGTVVTPGERERLTGGAVSSAGARVTGTGFTVVRTSTGVYTVTFSPVYTAAPVVTPAIIASVLGGIVLTASPTTAGFTVNCFNTSTGALIDAAWHFHATGLD